MSNADIAALVIIVLVGLAACYIDGIIIFSPSLEHWLRKNYRIRYYLIMFGHTELFTEEMQKDYIAWLQTDEGKQYLEYGSEDTEGKQ